MSTGRKTAIIRDIFGDCYGSGSEMLFHCPKCEHHKRKLSINIEKDAWKCWVCDWSGRNLTKIVRRYGDLYHKKKWSELVNKVELASFEVTCQQSSSSFSRTSPPLSTGQRNKKR